MNVAKDKVISIEYTMTDTHDRVIDSTDNREALSFIQGRASVFPALEQALEGRPLGEQLTVTIPPEDAFGGHDAQLVQQIPRERFYHEQAILPGMAYKTVHEGEEHVVTVIAAEDDQVTVDANHPLAGEALTFKVVIVGVRDAIAEELRTGEVQEMDDIYTKELGASHS